ncbi:hypothetical protein KFU94_32765 [Chloroflexi bacterium TSY]|nr:hypothetical protein [Chloroflexi bacterium TSY]
MTIRLYTKSVVCAALLATLLCGCSFYVPKQGKVIVEVRHDEAYYAGFFRACEILHSQHFEGHYIQVKSRRNTTGFKPTDQCLQMVQEMMDLNAASTYSRNWPGMQPLSPGYNRWSESDMPTRTY